MADYLSSNVYGRTIADKKDYVETYDIQWRRAERKMSFGYLNETPITEERRDLR